MSDPMHASSLTVSSDANKYERASVYVQDAMRGRTTMAQDKESFFYHRVYINVVYVTFYRGMTLALLALAFWEGPSRDAPHDLATSPYRGIFYGAEAIFFVLFVFDSYLQYRDFGHARFMRKTWIRIKCACLGIFLLDLVLSAALPTAYVRYARALWPVYFIERNENIRKIVGSLLHAIPKIANVVVLVLVHITLFGVFAFVFFAGVSDENCEAWVGGSTAQRCSTYIIDGCSDYFQTLGQSILQLFILSTTANFPDVMMPAYRCNSWSGWFFVVFLVIGLYFLVNLTIAVTYTTFQELSKSKILKKHNRLLKGLSLAYAELTKNAQPPPPQRNRGKKQNKRQAKASKFAKLAVNFLLKDDWVCFMKTLRPDLPVELTRKLFDMMDSTREGMIVEQEFNQLVYHYSKLKAVPRQSAAEAQERARARAVSTASRAASPSSPVPTRKRSQSSLPASGSGTSAAGAASTTGPSSDDSGVASVPRFEAMSIESGGEPLRPVGLRLKQPLRLRLAMWSVSQRGNLFFDFFVVLNSVFICLFLGFEKDQDFGTVTPGQEVMVWLLYGTFAVFVIEIVLKMVCLGPLVYLRGDHPKPPPPPVDTLNPLAVDHMLSVAEALDSKQDRGGVSPVPRGRSESAASTGSQRLEVTRYPLYVDGGDDVDAELWHVDPIFNKLDVFVLVCYVTALVLEATKVVTPQVVVAITILRMLRLFRALRSVSGFTVTVFSFAQVVPLMARYFAVLFCILFSYAVLGMELFAGKLSPDNAEVASSAYGTNDYYVNNFDTLQNAVVVLFEQLVVNNWPIVMEGCVAATTLWARTYFLFFYGFCVVAVLSVLLAFLLEAFAVKREYNLKVVKIREVRKACGDGAAERMQAEELDEAWTNLLRQSGLDFSKWTLSRFTSHSDIYDVLFKDAIQQTHQYTTSDRSSQRSFLFARTGVAGALQEMAGSSSRSARRRTPSKRSYTRGSRG